MIQSFRRQTASNFWGKSYLFEEGHSLKKINLIYNRYKIIRTFLPIKYSCKICVEIKSSTDSAAVRLF